MKADEKIEESDHTNFEYLEKKVEILQNELEKIQKILKEHDLYLTVKEYADTDIDALVWADLDGEG